MVGKAREVAKFGDQRRRIDQCHAAHRLQRRHNRRERPVRQHRLDLRRQPVATGLGSFDSLNVIFEHEVVHRLLEFETCKPAAMQLRPGRPAIMAPLAQ